MVVNLVYMHFTSRNFVLFGLMMGLFLAAIEATVVTTAMPKAALALGNAGLYSWIFTAYILAATVSGPFWGRLSDTYGRKLVYVIGVSLFLLGSALSGASQDMFQLVIFRGLQGIGGGALLNLTYTIVGDLYSLKERSRVQGYLSSVWAIASILGPPLGGFIADNLDWRWVFYVNIPFGVLATVIVAKWLVDKKRVADGGLDIPGVILFGLSSASFLIYLTEYSSLGSFGWILLVVSVVSMALFIKVESSTKSPLIPFKLIKDRVIAISLVCSLLSGVAFFGTITYLPILLQWVMGLSASSAGILLTPTILGWVISSIISSRVLPKLTLKPVALVGSSFIALGLLLLILFPTQFMAPIGGFLIGLGMGSSMAPILITVQTVVHPRSLGIATALVNFMRSMGASIGVTLMWIPINIALDDAGLSSVSLIPEGQGAILTSAISNSFIIGLVAILICVPLYLILPKLDLEERDKTRLTE